MDRVLQNPLSKLPGEMAITISILLERKNAMADVKDIISAHQHPKEIKSFNNGYGVAKQRARIARRDARKKDKNGKI